MAIPINKKKVDEINARINPQSTPTPEQFEFEKNKQRQQELETRIKSGTFSAEDTRVYNQMTGNQQGARELALQSPEAIQNLQTTITPEETAKIAQAGITDIGEGVNPDMTAGTKEEFKQAIQPTETTKVTTETTPIGTIKTTETPTGTPKIETIDQFKQAGGGLSNLEQLVENRYKTVATQNPDGSLTAEINGEKFKWTLDANGNPIKQSLGKVGADEIIQTQLDPNNLFNQIRSGQVPTKDIQNTDEYKKSKQRADNLARFENMSAKDLSYSINNGDLLPGTQTYNDLKAIKPDLVAEAEKLNSLNSALTTTEKSNTDVLTKITEQIFKIFNGDTTTLKTKLSQNPEVVKLNTDMATKKNELDSLKDSINNSYRDIEEELSGTGATKGYIQALASRRTEDLTRDYNTKLNEYNTMAGQLKTITEMVGDELEQEEKQQAKQLQALQFAYGIAKDETDYQRSLQAEQRQREYQQAQDIQNFEQQKEMLALQQEYEDRNIQTDMIQVGNKNVLINRKTGETIKSFDLPTQITKPEGPIKMGEDSLYDPVTKTWITKPSATTTTDLISKWEGFRENAYQDSAGVWTYGYGFTKRPDGTPVQPGDTISQGEAQQRLQTEIGNRQNYMNYITVPLSESQKAALSSFEFNLGSGIWEKNAMPILDAINAGDLTKAGQLMKQYTQAGGKYVQGLANRRNEEASLLQQKATTGRQYNDNDIALLGSVTKLDKQGREILKENGFTEQDWAKFNAGLLPPTQSQKIQTQEVLDLLTKLETSPGLNNAVGYKGPIGSFTTIAGTDKADFEALYNTFRDTLAFANLDKMKGAMSDKDIEFLRNTAGAINLDMSEKTFKKNLLDIKKKYTNLLNKGQISSNNKTQTNTQQSNQYKAKSGNVYNLNDYK